MKVSVIIPTHNRLWQLQAAYDSVCQQTKKPDEVIIIDDASTIAITHYLLNSRKTKIPTTIKRFNESQGACKARNYGIKQASSDIIMFLDDDDTWEKDKIALQLEIFKSDQSYGLVYSGRKVVSENNRDRVLYNIEPKATGKLYPQILYRNLVGSTSSVAVKRNLLLDVDGFDESLPALQDYDLWIRLSQKTLFAHDRNCSVRYTLAENPQGQISGNPEKYITAGQIIRQKYKPEIVKLSPVKQRKIFSALDFFVARYARDNNVKLSLIWAVKSFLNYPNFKALLLVIPLKFLFLIKNLQLKFKTRASLPLAKPKLPSMEEKIPASQELPS